MQYLKKKIQKGIYVFFLSKVSFAEQSAVSASSWGALNKVSGVDIISIKVL